MYSNNCRLKIILIILVISIHFTNKIWAQSNADANRSENKDSKYTEGGYSIFHETLVDLSWPEVKKAAEENALVLMPVVVIEEHGPHMSLGPDTYLSYQRARALKHKLESMQIKTVIAPPVYWGVMQRNETGKYPGSFTVRPSTMKALLVDIFEDLKIWGFHNIYCLIYHGDGIHIKTANEAITEAKEKFGLKFYNDMEEANDKDEPDFEKYVTGKLYQPDYHAGAFETSAMLEYYPESVNIEKAKTLKPENGFHPLGYAGDPANYKSINVAAYDKVDVDYNANCIAKWLKAQSNSKNK